ncbi:MAG: aldose epimerase family protein [Verrucomicrobiota bacterium]
MGNLIQKKATATLIVGAFAVIGLTPVAGQEVTAEVFGTLPNGKECRAFTLTNALGTRVRIAEYGALLLSVETNDRDGNSANITLSYATLEEALAGGVFGSVIGRYANRIRAGFEIDEVRYELHTRSPETQVHIHGGKNGFHRQLWKGEAGLKGGNAWASFSLTSPDGQEGYPGTVEVSVRYELTEKNVLRLSYRGTTDKPTHLNLTNHVYFNLAGGGDITNHLLRVDARRLVEINELKLPTGELISVEDTPFDLRTQVRLGDFLPKVPGGGLDHCYAVARKRDRTTLIAKLTDPISGRTLEVLTTKPGVQLFTANHFKGKPFPKWGGICFETQFYPDTPNQPTFPTSLLRPGETYQHTTEFRFGVSARRVSPSPSPDSPTVAPQP